MNFLRAFAVLYCVVWPVLVLAEPIPISTGEHGAFSRLVFESQNLGGWTYEKKGDVHLIKFPNQRDGFATQSIYRHITDDRLSSFEANKSEFQFRTDCACNVDIFEIGKNVLVIDIKTDNSAALQTSLVEFPKNALRSSPLKFGALYAHTGADTFTHLGVISMLNAQTQIPSEEVTKTSKSPNVIFPTLGSTLSELDLNEQSQALKDLQTQLLQEIGSASSRGVLDPSANLDLWRKAEQRPQVDPEIFDSSQEDASPQQSEKIQIRITSSADMMRSASSTIGATQSGHLCIDPVRVDISAWSDGRSFEQQLAMLRRGLFTEFDQLDEGTAVNLTRFYLYYGFGAEALNILTLIADGAEKWPELFEMAEILEFGFSDSGQVLRQNIDCNSAGALWGILAAKKLDLDRTINVQAALRSVDSLPPHLRKFLAPELSNRLLKYGDRKGAKMAMRNLDRLSSPGDERATLASADIKISEGGLDTAGVLLNEVVNSNSEFSARALISLIETEMDTGRSIDVATANLVDAYAMELRDAPIGAELLRVHVLALAKSGQFKESFVALDDLSLDEDAKDLRTKLFQLLIADAGNAVFLELMFEYMPSLTDVNEKELVFEAAVRLHALGFSEAAEKFLDDGQALSNSNSHRILNARIALDLGRPAAADVFLVNLKGEEADLLRAKINEQKLDRIKAHEIYSQLQDTQAAQENAWLSADWQTLTDPNVAAFGSLVPVANQSLEQSENPIGMMARSKSLLDESTQVRDVISSIFQNETE